MQTERDGLVSSAHRRYISPVLKGERTMKTSALLVCALFSMCALASQPGEPYDCDDWVILKPGITCHVLAVCDNEQSTGNPDFPCLLHGGVPVGADGRLLDTEQIEVRNGLLCGSTQTSQGRVELKSSSGADEELVAFLPERCCPNGRDCVERVVPITVVSDATNGRLFVVVQMYCDACNWPSFMRQELIAFDGFTSLFDILQSFTPAQVGFRVPVMPEGMRAVDHFDTYWGALNGPLDLASAQPLYCAYPAAPPKPGDYLPVAATVPRPAPGSVNYVLTSATYQGNTRAGRAVVNGRLVGRDASGLPACVTEVKK